MKKKIVLLFIILTLFNYLILIYKSDWKISLDWSKIAKVLSTPDKDIGVISTTIFGITGGVIALIGLVAIFISINSQHKIQKCRELYWEAIQLSFQKKDTFDLSNEMINLLWQYSKISANDDEEFVNNIIKGSQKTILYVLVVWTMFIPFAIVNFSIIGAIIILFGYLGSISALTFFHNILGRLNNLVDIGKLKKTETILDLSQNKDFQGLFLLVDQLKLERINSGANQIRVWPILNAPIKGFKATLTGVQYITWGNAHETKEKQINLKSTTLREFGKTKHQIRMDQFGDSDILDIDIDIKDHSKEIKNWLDNGMFWSTDNYPFIQIQRMDDRLGFYNKNEKPGYEISLNKEEDSGIEHKIVNAIVPSDTYTIRLSMYISLNDDEYLAFLWEIPMDLQINPRIVSIRIGGYGRVAKTNYWDFNQIEEDFEAITQKEKEKDARWS